MRQIAMSISKRELERLRAQEKIEIGEVDDLIPKRVAELKDIISKDPTINLHPSSYDDIYLRCIRTVKYDIPRAAKLYKNFCQLRQMCVPGIREHSVPSLQEQLLKNKMISILSSRDRLGRHVVLLRLSKWDPEKTEMVELFATYFCLLDEALASVDTQLLGFVVIADMKDVGWSHAKHIQMNYCKTFFRVMQDSYPARFKELHLLNTHTIVNIVIGAAKPFLKEKIRKRLFFHGNNIDSFLKSVDARILPVGLGGKVAEEDYDDNGLMKSLLQKDDYYKDFFNYGYSEDGWI